MITPQTDGRKMICDRCRRAVPIADVKFLPKGKDSKITLCSMCRDKNTTDEKEATVQKASKKKPYFCARCRYKFQFDRTGVTNFKCPYCGSGDKILEAEPKSSEALLQGISGNRF